MNFLTRRALKRAQRRLGPRMKPGEQLVAFDICRSSSDLGELLQGRGTRFDVIVSDQAVYLIRNGDVRTMNRLTFDDIESVRHTPCPDRSDTTARLAYAMAGPMARLVVIRLWNGDALAFAPYHRNGRSETGPELLARVPDRTLAVHRLEMLPDGRGVTVTQSAGPQGSVGFTWGYEPDDGVDVRSPALRGKFRAEMYRLMCDAGDPNCEQHKPE